MNFKPTRLNMIIPLIIAVIVGAISYNTAMITDGSIEYIISFKRQQGIYAFLISFVVVYVLTSSFQKKKKE